MITVIFGKSCQLAPRTLETLHNQTVTVQVKLAFWREFTNIRLDWLIALIDLPQFGLSCANFCNNARYYCGNAAWHMPIAVIIRMSLSKQCDNPFQSPVSCAHRIDCIRVDLHSPKTHVDRKPLLMRSPSSQSVLRLGISAFFIQIINVSLISSHPLVTLTRWPALRRKMRSQNIHRRVNADRTSW